MKIESARELKLLISNGLLSEGSAGIKASALRVQPARLMAGVSPSSVLQTIAVGVSQVGKEFKLAVRIQTPGLEQSPAIEEIRRKSCGEVDIRFVGHIHKQAVRWTQKQLRPLLIGASVGHHLVTAGSLGAFVRIKGEPSLHLLSNNHVLANENKAKKGDAILHPGALDSGVNPDDQIASLTTFKRLRKTASNLMDAAIARLDDGIEPSPDKLRGLGKLKGLGSDFLEAGTPVAKIGRTTGLTRGRVTAFELDNVVVGYGIGDLRFDNQIEIEGDGLKAFSQGGDSGSLIVEEGHAVALLFAGTKQGGQNGQGLTYANPLHPVLKAFKIELAL